MKLLLTFVLLTVFIALVSSSPYGFYNSFTGDFGGPSAFSADSFVDGSSSSLSRGDNRQNRGPVVFPVVENPVVESSGVVIGASGFGFVPPGQNSLGFLQRIMMGN